MFFPPSPFLVRHVALGRVRVRVYRPRRRRPKPRRRPRWKLLESLRRTEGWRRKPQSHRFSHVSCALRAVALAAGKWPTLCQNSMHTGFLWSVFAGGDSKKKGFCRFCGWISRYVSLIPKKNMCPLLTSPRRCLERRSLQWWRRGSSSVFPALVGRVVQIFSTQVRIKMGPVKLLRILLMSSWRALKLETLWSMIELNCMSF